MQSLFQRPAQREDGVAEVHVGKGAMRDAGPGRADRGHVVVGQKHRMSQHGLAAQEPETS
ncbi:hypothetical protein D3C87_2073660 [compost metagenome]